MTQICEQVPHDVVLVGGGCLSRVYTAMYCDLDDSVPGSPPQNVRARPVSSNTVVVQWDEPKLSNGVIRVRISLYQLM